MSVTLERPIIIQIFHAGYHFDEIWLYDVIVFGQNLGRLTLSEIVLDEYFQFYNSTITLLDTEYDSIFTTLDQIR